MLRFDILSDKIIQTTDLLDMSKKDRAALLIALLQYFDLHKVVINNKEVSKEFDKKLFF
jgi:hypothetical protein